MTLPNDRTQPAVTDKPGWPTRLLRAHRRLPAWLKITVVACAVLFFPVTLGLIVLAALAYAVVAVVQGRRTAAASASVAVWGLTVFSAFYSGDRRWLYVVLLLPVAVALAAHVRPLARWFVPCRTVAWALGWSVPVGVIALRLWPQQPLIGVIAAWLLAVAVLGWRVAKGLQEARMYGRSGRYGAAGSPPMIGGFRGDGTPPDRTGSVVPPDRHSPGGRFAGQPGQPGQPAGPHGYGVRAQQAALPYAEHAVRGYPGAGLPRPRPQISVADAMAELDAMIGLAPVKEQVRSIAASIEAARRRAQAGVATERPMRHFVFLGPPGTGKTTVARVLATIFYAFGLLELPDVTEAHRADLVGEFLGATAIKTNELIDSALGGVLFIDEAYSLVNEGDGQTDRFGAEAVQTLLKRAEDDRERLIIVLAGYEKQMETFLASNPGLASRFATRLKFPSYSPAELLALAEAALDRRGEMLDPDARPVLWRTLEEVGRRRMADELGNGRFVRSLLEKAGQARDVRVMRGSADPAPQDLVTLRASDLQQAYAELTSRLRGYEDTPTVEGAIAELDELVGLEPVKQQVRAIAAQLRVAKMRDTHGLTSQPPARHFVFTGPPGTGKTTVARILGRIFAALGLLVRPEVVEAHRADLVGEHLGSTAIKTNKLIDSAMGGVLFVDEAYSLHNEGYSGGDAFGAEAVATLLKRAEDDRDRLVIVLAGYPDDTDRFLRSNPGLASRFSTRVTFPSYAPRDLVRIAELLAEQAGDCFDPAARDVLGTIFAEACQAGRIDELGNGRFARSLFERACACRDVRVVRLGEQVTAEDLTTLTAADVETAYRDLAVSNL
ncbi:MAG: AAA family ATPase [Streptosporangiaceae bacterium]|nr:AAA family ATPase [Streptosporangiaceae bacterium]